MREVARFMCEKCGELFTTASECIKHEYRHERIQKANEMLASGCTLGEIQHELCIWESLPDHLKDVNKYNCFAIFSWQGCRKPAYQIKYIYFDGCLLLGGQGALNGWCERAVAVTSKLLCSPNPPEALFVYSNQ